MRRILFHSRRLFKFLFLRPDLHFPARRFLPPHLCVEISLAASPRTQGPGVHSHALFPVVGSKPWKNLTPRRQAAKKTELFSLRLGVLA